jgi:uncharacterized protein (TIGR00730 family)
MYGSCRAFPGAMSVFKQERDSMPKTICVFAGSSSGGHPQYVQAARELGREIVARNYGLVYGGAAVGLMGALADAVLEDGGNVIGVMPDFLVKKEIAHRRLSDLRVVQSMHERKALMAELADGFVALPGGYGTIEEFFEILTWGQLGMHRKPCALFNVGLYYERLLEFLDHVASEELLKPIYRSMIIVAADARTLLNDLEKYRAPNVPKWIEPSKS